MLTQRPASTTLRQLLPKLIALRWPRSISSCWVEPTLPVTGLSHVSVQVSLRAGVNGAGPSKVMRRSKPSADA